MPAARTRRPAAPPPARPPNRLHCFYDFFPTRAGGCAPEYRTNMYTIPASDIASGAICEIAPDGTAQANGAFFVPSDSYACASAGVMRSATMWLGISGGLLMTVGGGG